MVISSSDAGIRTRVALFRRTVPGRRTRSVECVGSAHTLLQARDLIRQFLLGRGGTPAHH
jgi:hypothetical protein